MKKIYSFLLFCSMMIMSCTHLPENVQRIERMPSIYPDYIGVTVPVDIAPLNFNIASDTLVEVVDVVVKGANGGEIHSNGAWAKFDIDEWHGLLEKNKGAHLDVTVAVRIEGKWYQYNDFQINVSSYPVEEWGLTYRRIAPGYEVFSSMGLYQRELSSFDEYAIIENTQVPGMCVNCHTANRTNPDNFVFHVRGGHGATMIQRDGKREWLKARNDSLGGSMVYPYWHPSGKYCAFSTNQTRQGFHIGGKERIEVFDQSSDIFVYDVEKHEIIMDTLIATTDYSENCPVFSPDGKTIYFTTCLQQEYPRNYKKEQYNLCSIAFDPDKGTYGDKVDTLFNAVKREKSVTWPRPSYDGKYLLFTLIDYGYFSIWHDESEQWMLDLATGEAHPIESLKSNKADSYHNWSTNSHWIVFTSRRGDGLYTRLYLAEVNDKGEVSKPFLLPQENPWEYYSEQLHSYNTPDFTSKRVEFDNRAAGTEIASDIREEFKVR